MNPLVEVCDQNMAKGGRTLFEDSPISEKIDLVSYGCTSNCDLCAQKFFCIFEGEILSSDTLVELEKMLVEKIAEWEDLNGE
ncbi:MAG: YuzB family protein [Lactobacillales bacterium]|nr:YuzB family protein [Lactobacillales bacterium]